MQKQIINKKRHDHQQSQPSRGIGVELSKQRPTQANTTAHHCWPPSCAVPAPRSSAQRPSATRACRRGGRSHPPPHSRHGWRLHAASVRRCEVSQTARAQPHTCVTDTISTTRQARTRSRVPRRAATIIKPARTIDRKVCDGIRNAWCGRGRCREQHKQPRGAAIDQWPPQLNCRIPHRITQVSRLQLRTLTRVQQRCTMRHRHVGDARCDPGLQCAVSRHHVFGELVHRIHQTGSVRAGCTHNTPRITGHVSLKHIRCS